MFAAKQGEEADSRRGGPRSGQRMSGLDVDGVDDVKEKDIICRPHPHPLHSFFSATRERKMDMDVKLGL